MAYVQDDDENQAQGLNQALAPNANQPGAAPTSQPSEQGTGPAPTGQSIPPAQSSTPTPAARNTQPNAKAGSGMFTNLKNYLTANQGNRIAGAATQKVANLATGAQKGISHASTAFGQKVEQGTLANRANALQDVQGIVQGARQSVAKPQVVANAPSAAPAQEMPPEPVSALATPPNTPASATAQPEPVQPVEQPKMAEPQYLTNEQQSRFADIINARYQGPESLRQAGLLEPAQQKVNAAAQQIKNAQTAQGREELLRSMFGKNRDYTQGQSKLDALLLNTSQQGVGQLQQAAKQGQGITQQLQSAENQSQNLAQNRAQEISDIRNQSRQAFQTGRTEEEAATEKRIDDLIKTPVMDAEGKPVLKLDGTPMTQWDQLPEHFRQSLANKASTAKTAQQEMLAAADKLGGAERQQITTAQDNINALQKQLDKTLAVQPGLLGPADPESMAAYNKALSKRADLQQQINAEKQKLSSAQASPEYQQYQQQLAAANNMNMNQWMLSPEEAAVLGISSGEGLYNTTPDQIKTAQADRERLISQNEFARQQALAQLAGLDLSKGLQKELKYTNRDKAGTQSLQDSLDTEAFRNQLNEAQNLFKQSAEGADLTGTGSKKVSRGNAFGKKTKTYNAQIGGNVADMLRQAGYDVGQEGTSQAKSILGNQEDLQKLFSARGNPLTNQPIASNQQALGNYLGATNTNRDSEYNIGGNNIEGGVAGGVAGSQVGGPVGGAVGAFIGASLGSNSVDPYQHVSDTMNELDQKYGIKGLGAVGKGIEDVRSVAGKAVTPILGKGIGGMIGGIDTGAMKAYGDAIAKQGALEDLKNKYTNYLQGQGFENRANIVDTGATQARAQALRDLLSRKG